MRVLPFLLACVLAVAIMPLRAADDVGLRALRVCQDPNNLPFSNEKGEGLENRIARILAAKMSLPLESYWYPQRMNVLRNTLRYKLPGDTEFRCDLLTGVPAESGSTANTTPYYRSTYVLVYVKGRGIDVQSAEEFLALDTAILKKLRIGVYDRSPPVRWLNKYGLIDSAVPFRMLNPDPNHYPGAMIDRDLIDGKIDVALVWGPVGGYSAKHAQGVELVVVPLHSEPGVPFDFAIAMGMRHGEPDWRKRVQSALDGSQKEIAAVLRDFGVPLVDENGRPQ